MARQQKKRKKRPANPAGAAPLDLSTLTPQKLAVITGLLTAALSVDSILIDKDQRLQIVLGGSLRRKTRVDRLVSELSQYNVDEILDSIANR